MKRPVQSEMIHEGELFAVEVLTMTDDDGRVLRREVVRHPGAVVIVPVLDPGRLLLIKNYRIAVDEHLWELPAGKLEPGEEPQHAAARELEEETGYRAASIRPLTSFYTSPGFADELMHAFVATNLSFVGQKLEFGEEIVVEEVARDEIRAWIAGGEIRDGKTIAAFLVWDALVSGST